MPGSISRLTRFLQDHLIAVVVVLFLAAAGWVIYNISRLQSDLVQSTSLKEARAYSDAIREFRTLYTSEVVERVREQGVEVTHNYENTPGAIPLPATLSMMLGESLVHAGSGNHSLLYSPYPFPWREETGGLRNEFCQDAWEALSLDSEKPFFRIEEQDDGGLALRYATADLMRASCVNCHNNHPDTPKRDWKEGDLRGVIEVVLPLDPVIAQTRGELTRTIYLIVIPGALALLGLVLTIRGLKRASLLAAEKVVELEREVRECQGAERARTESKEMLGAVVNSAVDGIITINESGIILSFNAAAEHLFGWTGTEAIGRNIKFLMPEPFHSGHDGYLRQYLDTGEAKIIGLGREVIGKRKNGTTFPMDLAVSEVNLEYGRLFTGIVRDISERKQAEDYIERINQELAAKNEELEEFVYTASHDLKSPLVTIMGFLGYLQRDIEKGCVEKLAGYSERIAGAADRMTSNIDDLLEISRIGRAINDPKPVCLNELFDTLIAGQEAVIQEIGVTIEIQPDLPVIETDEVRLEQIFENLIVNALKYGCTNPQPVIRIGFEEDDEYINFFVADNGPGVPEPYQKKIFGLFQRLQTGGEGTGIGLAIVKRIAEGHGGRIWIEVPPAGGSIFRVSFPRTMVVTEAESLV